jgi:transporter family protein
MNENWLVWALLSAAFAALTALLSKAGLRGVDPDAAQFVRTAVVLAATAALVLAAGSWRGISQFAGRTWLFLALAGLATAASWVCYYRALAAGQASQVAAIDKLSVPLVAVIAVVIMSERLGPLGWLGVALTTLGAVLVSLAR